ncbi:MAG: serine hydrolase [Bacteroidia bacterium]|nr:serine hydrolase [Bacteroidia bacterium]
MKILLFAVLLSLPLTVRSQNLYFPPLTGNAWDTLSPASLGWCQDEIDSLIAYLDTKNTKAFLLLKDGKIVIEQYFGTFTVDSAWYWASAGKTLTAFTLGIAQQEGLLSIQDTSAQYLGAGWTACPPLKEEKITIRNQLTMTTGLDDGVPDHYCTLDTCLQYLADAGTRWAYHNGPYTLLDSVIESASGQPLNSYFNQKVKALTGMTGAFFPSGYNNVFVSKPRSMARFGLLMLNEGNWNGTQVMTDTAYFQQMISTSQNFNLSYGYLWWLNGKPSFMAPGLQFAFPGPLNTHAPADMYAALGKDGQMLNVVPSLNLVYVRMGDAPGVGEVPLNFNDSIWAKLNAAMCNTTALNTVQQETGLRIYPNPATDFLTVSLPGAEDLVLELLDLSGRVLFREETPAEQARIPLGHFPSGLYALRLSTGKGGTLVRKVQVIH